jgi:hypothetical protein
MSALRPTVVLVADESEKNLIWCRTIGAPTPGDPRDGELHQFYGRPPRAFDLEPWDEDAEGQDAHYVLEGGPPSIEEDGRTVWRYIYSPA